MLPLVIRFRHHPIENASVAVSLDGQQFVDAGGVFQVHTKGVCLCSNPNRAVERAASLSTRVCLSGPHQRGIPHR